MCMALPRPRPCNGALLTDGTMHDPACASEPPRLAVFVEWAERITVPSLRSSGHRSWVASQRRAALDRLCTTLRITRRMAVVAFESRSAT